MKRISKLGKNLLFIVFIINILFSKGEITTFNITINIESNELKDPYIKYSNFQFIPSLFTPILLVGENFDKSSLSYLNTTDIKFKFYNKNALHLSLYKLTNENNFELYLGYDLTEKTIKKNYFGLSLGLETTTPELNENLFNLAFLKENKKINNKIFSFDKWKLIDNENLYESKLYIGSIHENFISGEGIKGSCKNFEENAYWGCLFDEMLFQNNSISLKKEDNNLYKIYFSSEYYDIKFPDIFKELLINNSNNKCLFNEIQEAFICKDLDENNDYIPLKLISENMNITLEIDNSRRFYTDKGKEIETRIKFENIDYIIFPLIMFKNFDVQFDGETNYVSFYTTNKDILEVKKEEPNNNEESSSSSIGLKIFLSILIILLIIGIGFGLFYFIKKRKHSNVEKNINRFTKFEDEEDFQAMNEKKVY